jgi:hypothetical protein
MNKIVLTAVPAAAAAAVAAHPGLRKGARQLHAAVVGVIRNPPMEWEDPDTGQVVEVDRFSRRQRWTITRPLWWYTLGARKLDCGCTRRLGRITLYSSRCEKHSSFGKYLVARRRWLESADWDDVLQAVERLTGDDPPDLVAPTNDRGFLGYADIIDSYGGQVRVYQSSSAEGDYVWLNVDASEWLNSPDVARVSVASSHLDRAQAARVVRGLTRWLADTDDDGTDQDGREA